jgi:hypothetical protein
MVNPDAIIPVSAVSQSVKEVNPSAMGAVCGGIMAAFTLIIIAEKGITPGAIAWICFVSFIVSLICNGVSQSMGCTSGNFANVFSSSLLSIPASLLAFGVSYFSICRIPVTSVFAPAFITPDHTIDTKGQTLESIQMTARQTETPTCCKIVTLDSVESKYKYLKAIPYSFYMFFAILFAVTAETSLVIQC